MFRQNNRPEIENVSNMIAIAPMKEQVFFSSCVPVFVKFLDQDKDADENVDADHVRTEHMDINFRVSVLPHAVVRKKVQNFCVREFVKIESHLHRRALQAKLKQDDAYNPFVKNRKVTIRDVGNVELFEFCETIPKVQCSECLLCWNHG